MMADAVENCDIPCLNKISDIRRICNGKLDAFPGIFLTCIFDCGAIWIDPDVRKAKIPSCLRQQPRTAADIDKPLPPQPQVSQSLAKGIFSRWPMDAACQLIKCNRYFFSGRNLALGRVS